MEGSIAVKDVRPALLVLGQIPTDKELNNLIDLIDNEGNSYVTYVTFTIHHYTQKTFPMLPGGSI